MLPITSLIATALAATLASGAAVVPETSFSKDFSAPINPPAVYLDSGKRLTVYYGGWSTYNGRTYGNAPSLPYPLENYQPADIPIKLLTDVNYSFYVIANKTQGVMSEVPASKDNFADFKQVFNPSNKENPTIRAVTPDTPDQKYFGNFGQFMKLKRKSKYNFGLAIGGWIDSTYFSSAMKTPAVFVDGVIDVLKKYPGLFNHIDIDWEYVQNTPTDQFGNGNEASVDDPKNFAKFLRLLRERLDKEHLGNMEITAALSANPKAIVQLPIKAMVDYLDFFNIMTYDFQSSAWGSEIAGPHSNLYSVEPYAVSSADRAVKTFLSLGVPANKINIGVAFYTRANGNTKGLNQTTSGEGSEYLLSKCINDGSCDYGWMPLPGHVEYWDSASKAAYSLDAERGDMLTYDTIYSVAEKCQYVWDHGLAGLFAWEAANDVRDSKSKRSLMSAMHNCLVKDPRRNHGTKCNAKKEAKGCAATSLATCTNNKWVVTACPDGQVCQGTGSNTKCALP
ncbi:glycosyl hydrolases family 18-domain-containing protein [Obelidium mucronatum]|nr:glycosyl hydrolases family 18-domain-containing protein [Obelidium mucronatum]